MEQDHAPGLTGQLLIAMPGIGDPRFDRTVIYLCTHDEDGAMGLVVNRPAHGVSFKELLRQLEIEMGPDAPATPIRFGGPVEMGRGFVLHSADFHVEDSTMRVAEDVSLTATVEVLKAMAAGQGPQKSLVALGYSGWGPAQLEEELQRNGWLTASADAALLFDAADEDKWERALASIGVDPSMLSATGGSA